MEVAADPKTDPLAEAGVFPNTDCDPLDPPNADVPLLWPPKTDPEVGAGLDPKTELSDVIVTAFEDPNTDEDSLDAAPEEAATGADEDDPKTAPADDGVVDEAPKPDPLEAATGAVEDVPPPKIPPGLEVEPPKTALL